MPEIRLLTAENSFKADNPATEIYKKLYQQAVEDVKDWENLFRVKTMFPLSLEENTSVR